ncbi:HDOD domain protein [mine drainage metagenome]|uniref:HDOD domain protein n=1 Tax=mine drainage metagenome TaxID=410659 RepID=A0A1J5Q2I2_9ZZZZ
MSLPDRAPFSDLQSLIRTVTWPVMAETGQALIRTFNDDDADSFTICRIIKKDPALTATLLRMANSALFGLSGSVDTLERAVSVVGLARVRSQALALCMARVSHFPAGMDRMAFWHYSLRCAGYAHWLADLCSVDDQEAWLCGMMLRLGSLSLVQARPHCLAQLEALPVTPGERWLRQRALIGFDEGEVTAELVQHWDFPLALVLGMRYCAQPLISKQFSRLAGVVHLAAHLADSGPVSTQSVEQLPGLLMQMMQLDPATLLSPPDESRLTDISMFVE